MTKCFFYIINSQHYFFKGRFLLLDCHLILMFIFHKFFRDTVQFILEAEMNFNLCFAMNIYVVDPVAVYVRKSALDEHIEVHYNITAELPELQKLIAEYSAIGNNLNQIAQFFHSGGFHSKSMQDEINRHLTALWQLRQEAIKLGGTYHGRVKTHRNKKR